MESAEKKESAADVKQNAPEGEAKASEEKQLVKKEVEKLAEKKENGAEKNESSAKREENDAKKKENGSGKKENGTEKKVKKETKVKPKGERKRKSERSGSNRVTRSTDFYVSMVEESIKLEELKAKQAIEAKARRDEPKAKKPVSTNAKNTNESKSSVKKPQKAAPAQSEESEPSERSFGELKNILRNSTTMDLAKKIIGVNLCRRIDGQKIIGRIVDTEAYIGPVDKCSVTFKKKKSKALASYFAESGTACVEFVEDGNTHLAISSALPGEYVLVSALQPMLGREKMKALRGMRPSATDKNLTSTANDLAAALKVTMEFDGLDLLEGGGDIWLEPGVTCPKVVKTRRAIDMNNEKNWQEWSFKKLRFYSATSHCIKTRDQKEDQNTVLQTLPEDVDHI